MQTTSGWKIGISLLVAVAILQGTSCQHTQPSRPLITVPTKHSVRSETLLVQSDFRLPKDHPLITDLIDLRGQVSSLLDLPEQRKEVVVYLFSNETEYTQYLNATYPGLPKRRAYFVGTPRELAVYTYWGERIQEDLRHEYTHGLLHSCLKEVPLWLDEGLAEYFEVIGPEPGQVNVDYAQNLMTLLGNGWRPDLKRLEQLDKFEQMQRIDYQEAWAWVHFMLHSSPDTREPLVSYLRDLRTETDPTPLSVRLEENGLRVQDRFMNYIATLRTVKLLHDPKFSQPNPHERHSNSVN
ncbi:MAG: DUF1570 domain-containing protein [Planctomycetaceae bacterium]|nr:DUF1570 domain-containing protein [Planctomycetaceae bacterium]